MAECYDGCMNDEQLNDLKRFIDARVSQSEARADNKFAELRKQSATKEELAKGFAEIRKDMATKEELAKGFAEVRKDMMAGFAAISDALEWIHDHIELTDARLTRLERRTI